jgi:V/A-type H+/Na+-transporting ATPase subunit E
MAYENLLKSVEESAQERERELREKARITTQEILNDTKNQETMIQQSILAEAKKTALIEKNKLIYLTKNENKQKMINTRETIFLRAFGEAEQRLSRVRNDPNYPAIFKKLTLEAVGALGGEKFRIHIDKQDEQLIKKILAELNLSGEVLADLTTAGGLVACTLNETVKISNTFESRLERAKEQKKLEVYAVLFGD